MKNKLIFPDGTPYKPAQIGRILDVWSDNPVGIQTLLGDVEFPDLEVTPVYSGGWEGKDVRYIALTPLTRGPRYEILVADAGQTQIPKLNPKIKTEEISVGRARFLLEKKGKEVERYALKTKVTPKNGGMTHNAVLNVSPRDVIGKLQGRIWAHSDRLAYEDGIRKTMSEIMAGCGEFF